jgi:hypothetical protein
MQKGFLKHKVCNVCTYAKSCCQEQPPVITNQETPHMWTYIIIRQMQHSCAVAAQLDNQGVKGMKPKPQAAAWCAFESNKHRQDRIEASLWGHVMAIQRLQTQTRQNNVISLSNQLQQREHCCKPTHALEQEHMLQAKCNVLNALILLALLQQHKQHALLLAIHTKTQPAQGAARTKMHTVTTCCRCYVCSTPTFHD